MNLYWRVTRGCVTLGWLLLGLLLGDHVRADDTVTVTCPVVADVTLFSGQPEPGVANSGASEQLQARSINSFVLMRFDLEAARGLEIEKATLRLRRVRDLLTRVGVSTVATDVAWVEGQASKPRPEPGSVCYNYAAWREQRQTATPWALPGSDFSDVIFGNGGSRWATCVARFDKESLWYEIDIPPDFIHAMVSGLQPGGLCLSDDFGRTETAPTFFSRETGDKPELVVCGQRISPGESQPPTAVRTWRDTLGREWVEFSAPEAIGFAVYLCPREPISPDDLKEATELAVWSLPAPGAGILSALLSLQRTGQHRFVAVRALDPGGAWSPFKSVPLPARIEDNPEFTAPELERFDLPVEIDEPFTLDDGPALSEDGRWMRSAGQTWWHPQRGPITLQSGRNEFIAFQTMLAGGPGTYAVAMSDWESPGAVEPAPRVRMFRQHYVQSRLGQEKYAPDALIEISPGQPLKLDLLSPAEIQAPRTQPARRKVVQGIWIDIYVPRQAARGVWRSRLVVMRDGRALLDIPLELEVLGATLPDNLGFKVSLTSDRLPAQAAGVDADSPTAWNLLEEYYRVAHAHRVTLAINPYRPDGRVRTGFAPEIIFTDGQPRLVWDEWDSRFGRYLDGSAFRDLPRAAVPLDHFCLPFHENWPMNFAFERAPGRSHLSGKYHYSSTWTERRSGGGGPRPDQYMVWPIEQAFSSEYQEGTGIVLRQFADHLIDRNWNRTDFLLTLTNSPGADQTSSWWHLGQPQAIDDVRALGFWLGMYRGVLAETGQNPIRLRANVAWPQFQRDILDGLVDISAQSQTFLAKSQLVLSHPQRFPAVWMTYPRLAPEAGWSEIFKLGWSARLGGARGVVCRQALGIDESWDTARDDALLYPGQRYERDQPFVSLRLKALRRLQQDQDWLEQWMHQVHARGIPEGYALSVVGATLAKRVQVRISPHVGLLPIVEFPGRLDTVVFEELRRGLRQLLNVPKEPGDGN
ncbi:MAG: hypothetical protein ABIG44_02785 [Planctomycetota bacterium]